MKLPEPMVLQVSFDADQISGQLDWKVLPNCEPLTGRHAGAILFEPGAELGLEVTGYGKPYGDFQSFQIVECCIITRPQVVQIGSKNVPVRYAAPSPFVQGIGASLALENDFDPLPPVIDPDGTRAITQRWKHQLNVNQAPGRWNLSFLLTLRMLRGEGQVQETRVFYFDPESEVGDGSNPGRPQRKPE